MRATRARVVVVLVRDAWFRNGDTDADDVLAEGLRALGHEVVVPEYTVRIGLPFKTAEYVWGIAADLRDGRGARTVVIAGAGSGAALAQAAANFAFPAFDTFLVQPLLRPVDVYEAMTRGERARFMCVFGDLLIARAWQNCMIGHACNESGSSRLILYGTKSTGGAPWHPPSDAWRSASTIVVRESEDMLAWPFLSPGRASTLLCVLHHRRRCVALTPRPLPASAPAPARGAPARPSPPARPSASCTLSERSASPVRAASGAS